MHEPCLHAAYDTQYLQALMPLQAAEHSQSMWSIYEVSTVIIAACDPQNEAVYKVALAYFALQARPDTFDPFMNFPWIAVKESG